MVTSLQDAARSLSCQHAWQPPGAGASGDVSQALPVILVAVVAVFVVGVLAFRRR